MHKAELVWCRFEIDVSGLVTSQVEDMIFPLTLMSMGKKQTAFQKTLISQGYTYRYILKLNDNIRNRNFKPVNQNIVTAIEFLKVAIDLFRVKPCFNNLEVRS